jgi:hypothetical protein
VVEMNHYSLFVTKNAQAWSTVRFALRAYIVTLYKWITAILRAAICLVCSSYIVVLVVGPILLDFPTVSPNRPVCAFSRAALVRM